MVTLALLIQFAFLALPTLSGFLILPDTCYLFLEDEQLLLVKFDLCLYHSCLLPQLFVFLLKGLFGLHPFILVELPIQLQDLCLHGLVV